MEWFRTVCNGLERLWRPLGHSATLFAACGATQCRRGVPGRPGAAGAGSLAGERPVPLSNGRAPLRRLLTACHVVSSGLERFVMVWNGCGDLWDTLRRSSLPAVQLSAAGASPRCPGGGWDHWGGGLAGERPVPFSNGRAPLRRLLTVCRVVSNGLE